MKYLLPLLFAFTLTACQKDKTDHAAWVGKWNGPEGTYLEIKPVGNGYSVAIADLDGEKIYSGVAMPDGIEFVRNSETLLIKAGNGMDTGMKWLADKKDCLVVKTGEGYCRD